MRLKTLVFASALLFAIGLDVAASVFIPREIPSRSYTGIEGKAKRGAYVARLAGCIECHTDFGGAADFLAGGAPINASFGSFRAPNITPHPRAGIGGWTLDKFSAALKQGVSPAGEPYYPVSPMRRIQKRQARTSPIYGQRCKWLQPWLEKKRRMIFPFR